MPLNEPRSLVRKGEVVHIIAMQRDRAYRRYMRDVLIAKRVKERMQNVRAEGPSPIYWLRPDVRGSLAKTPKRCSMWCCRSCDGPSIQELKNIDPEFKQAINEEFFNIL